MQARPQWLTVHTAAGEDFKFRLPAKPSVEDVKAMLDKIGQLAEARGEQMDKESRRQRIVARGWSLVQGPVARDN